MQQGVESHSELVVGSGAVLNTRTQPIEWSDAVRVEGSRERDLFIESNVDLARYVALRIAPRLPSSVDLDDLVHDGIIGLLDAANKFSPKRGVKFRTYAESRVRGAIVDGLRQKDWQPRALRRSQRELEATRSNLASVHGREPTEEELCEALELQLEELHQLRRDVAMGSVIPLDDHPDRIDVEDPSAGHRPYLALERKEFAGLLAEAITQLPERELKVLELYYHDGLNMKEVGAVLGVTESRVCQLHSQAAKRLRASVLERSTVTAATPVKVGR